MPLSLDDAFSRAGQLAMLGWAETYLYTSSTVSVFMEAAPGSAQTEMFVFKWARAGWAGKNVIKKGHLMDGVERYITSLREVTESPKALSPEVIKSRLRELKAMDDAALRAALQPLADALERESTRSGSPLKEEDFQDLLKDGGYVNTLSRQQMITELLRLFVRERLGKPQPAA